MLDFDMLGSSNYARFVYSVNEEKSKKMKPRTIDSSYIENVFMSYFNQINLITEPASFDGRSDYGPFMEAGIPVGGLFAGAEGRKSRRMALIYGGKANEPFDPCYHQSCDDFEHTGGNPLYSLALKSLDELSDAATHAAFMLANESMDRGKQTKEKEIAKEFLYRGNYLIK